MIAPQNNGNYSHKESPRNKGNALSLRVCLYAILPLAVVIGLWYFLAKDGGKPEPANKSDNKPAKIVEQTPAAASPIQEEVPVAAETNALPPGAKFYGHSSNVPTSNTNNIHYASQSGIRVLDADGNEYTVRSQPIFKSRVDNMLWAAIRPGGMPSGLNAIRSRMRHQTGSDAAFLEALRNQEIEISEDDPPHVQNAKQMTMEVKDSIIKAMDEDGRSFDDIYAEISETTRKERMYERIAQEDYRKMIQARDAEAIRKYVEDMNPVMEQMGLKKLRIPSWAEEGADVE